ncbi:hypothetical protein [Rheinheimera sp. NSM]|uniref:hypothetical protein n=1 Tax=Rheinheimera sp. NSM TaxID=3457884 RepID=UPI00403729CE
MKYSLSVLSVALCLSVSSVNAQSLKAGLQQNNVPAEQKVRVNKAASQYGVYQLKTELVAVPQALADRSVSLADVGNMTLVNRVSANDVEQFIDFRRNAVVQNSLTGELGVVTGNISLLHSKGSDIQNLLQQFNLKIVRSAGSTGVYIVQPQQDVDLLQLLTQIKASGLVKTARLDILEKKYSNQ